MRKSWANGAILWQIGVWLILCPAAADRPGLLLRFFLLSDRIAVDQ